MCCASLTSKYILIELLLLEMEKKGIFSMKLQGQSNRGNSIDYLLVRNVSVDYRV